MNTKMNINCAIHHTTPEYLTERNNYLKTQIDHFPVICLIDYPYRGTNPKEHLFQGLGASEIGGIYSCKGTTHGIVWDEKVLSIIKGSVIAQEDLISAQFIHKDTGVIIKIASTTLNVEQAKEKIKQISGDVPSIIGTCYKARYGSGSDCEQTALTAHQEILKPASRDLKLGLSPKKSKDLNYCFFYSKFFTEPNDSEEKTLDEQDAPKQTLMSRFTFAAPKALSSLFKSIFDLMSYFETRDEKPGAVERGSDDCKYIIAAPKEISTTAWGRFRNACAPRDGEDSKIAIVAALALLVGAPLTLLGGAALALLGGAVYFAVKAAKALR